MAPSKPRTERQKFWFQFITTPTADTPGTTILLHFDSRRYFFGRVAEGTQRACIQRGIGLKKVRNIFLTGPTTWSNMGGLIGMILTMADVQAAEKEGAIEGVTAGRRPAISIYGGPKMMHAMACARRFVFRTGMPLTIHEARWDESSMLQPSYSDENIDVWTLPVIKTRSGARSPVLSNGRSGSPTTLGREQDLREKTVTDMFDSDWRKDRLFESRFDQVKLPALIWRRNPQTKDLEQYRCTTMADAPHLSPDSIVLVRNPWPAATVEALPSTDNLPGSVSVSYIVRGQPQRGRFLPQKAKELGVKPGPDYAKLTTGESITLEDGTVITSEMVMTDPDPGRGMAVFDVPTVDYLHDLARKLERLRDNHVLVGLQTASWLLGPGVYESVEFGDLVRNLPDLEHFISSPDTNANYIALDSSAASAKRLSLIRPECFPEQIYDNEVKVTLPETRIGGEPKITIAQRGLLTQLCPKLAIDTSEVPPLSDFTDMTSLSEVQALIPFEASSGPPTPYDDVEMITLGTGSAVPSKYRNVSATLVRIPGLGSYLFDCGENTMGQLRRAYTSEQLDEVLCDLRMIWISHLHADHHLGTLSVIHARKEAVRRGNAPHDGSDLYVISEPNMADFLIDFSSIQSFSDCTLLSVWNSDLKVKDAPISVGALPLNIKKLRTVRVSHCHGAQAISVTFANGFKFSYSGDCRPSSAFADIGQDSHVLLHEATFDDGKEGDAMGKKHSTTSEALGVAAAMKAKNVVLTHFSQRYQKLPVLTNIKFADQIKFEESDETEVDDEAGDIVNSNQQESTEPTTTATAPPGEDSMLVKAAATMNMNICVAFDHMRIKYSQIPTMHLYYRAIERMFEIQLQISEEKRQEAAAINDQRIAAKQAKTGQKKELPSNSKSSSKKPSTTDLYESINRAKPTKNAHTQNSDDRKSRGDITEANKSAGQPSTPTTIPSPFRSSRALKQQQTAEERNKPDNEKRKSVHQPPQEGNINNDKVAHSSDILAGRSGNQSTEAGSPAGMKDTNANHDATEGEHPTKKVKTL